MKASADGGGCFPTGRHYPGIAHLIRISTVGLVEQCIPEASPCDLPLVAIDTETTGKDPETDRIVEIACVIWDGSGEVKRLSWLINPGCPIPAEAVAIHGIDDSKIAGAPSFEQIAKELLDALSDRVPLAYNAEFDRRFLMQELKRAGLNSGTLPPCARPRVEWIDPLVWCRELFSEAKSKSLSEMCERLNINLERAHRATDDAEAALHLFLALTRNPRVPKTYASLMQEQRRLLRAFVEERFYWRSN